MLMRQKYGEPMTKACVQIVSNDPPRLFHCGIAFNGGVGQFAADSAG